MSGGISDIADVDEVAVEFAEFFRIVAARLHLRAIFLVAQHGDEHLVELQIAAAGVGERAHGFPVGLTEIVEHRVELWIDLAVDRRPRRAAVQRRRRRDGNLRRALGVRSDEFEMLEHRVAGKADLAGDLDALVARGDGGECDALVHHMLFDAVEAPEEIEMPPGTAEFAVGDRLQADILLAFDDALDLLILDCLERGGVDLAFGAPLARQL